jgi:threonine aldolase
MLKERSVQTHLVENGVHFVLSDNCGRAAPELVGALTAANTGTALGYGGDTLTAALQTYLAEVFEAPVRIAAGIPDNSCAGLCRASQPSRT